MRGVEYNNRKEMTILELVLQLHSEFRGGLAPLRVTLLQAGVLLFLRRHAEANLTDAAAALRVRQPTLSEVMKDLVRKRWVTKRRSVKDDRIVHLLLSRQGNALAIQITQRIHQVEGALTKQDRSALGKNPKSRRT